MLMRDWKHLVGYVVHGVASSTRSYGEVTGSSAAKSGAIRRGPRSQTRRRQQCGVLLAMVLGEG